MRVARAALPLAVALTVALGAGGCADDAAPLVDAGTDARPPGLSAELGWRLRCDATGGGCLYLDHVVAGNDGDGDLDLTCSVVETAAARTVTLGASIGSLYTLAMQNVEIPRGSFGPPGTSGELVVLEQSEVYVGACGGAPPSPMQACQVTIGFTTDADGSLIVGEISCAGMVPFRGTMPLRELTAPGDAGATSPATFRYHHCRGYTPD